MNSAPIPPPPAGPALRVVTVVVVYADVRNPIDIVNRIGPFVDHTILVDNTPRGHRLIAQRYAKDGHTLVGNANRGGLAGAYNAAIARVHAEHPKATHVLFLDDDTDVDAIGPFLTSAVTRELAAAASVAAVAPTYVDRATGIRLAPIQLSRLHWRVLPRDLTEPAAVTFLINSMSLWRIDALRRIGPYDEELAVDHIDTDYCLRAHTLGYRLMLNPAVAFEHAIGARRKYRILGRTLQSGGHHPARREAIGRNTVVVARRHGWRWPAFAALALARLLYEALGIVVAEERRAAKLAALARGIASGLLAPPPPQPHGENLEARASPRS